MKRTFLSKTVSILGVIAALATVAGPSAQQAAQAQFRTQDEVDYNLSSNITAILSKSGGQYDDNGQDFDIFLNALQQTELARGLEEFEVDGTVLVPTDEAFLKFSRFFGYEGNDEAAVLDIINQNFAELNKIEVTNGGSNPNLFSLRDLLLYHLSDGIKTSSDLQNLKSAKQVKTHLLGPDGGDPFLRSWKISYINGTFIDGAPNLVDARLIPELTNISASNGIIHGVDRVLMPYFLTPTAPTPTVKVGQPVTIADIIAQSGEFDDNDQDFDILFRLIQDAELTDVFADPNADLTLFAPTDAAFIKFAQAGGTVGWNPDDLEGGAYGEVINSLQVLDQMVRDLPYGGNAVDLLQTILKYHVSSGARTAEEIQSAPSINTLLEGSAITPKDGKLGDLSPDSVDPQLQAGKTDMTASNGVIQGIDNVLLPNLFAAPTQ